MFYCKAGTWDGRGGVRNFLEGCRLDLKTLITMG